MALALCAPGSELFETRFNNRCISVSNVYATISTLCNKPDAGRRVKVTVGIPRERADGSGMDG